jgi:hypothetical protein
VGEIGDTGRGSNGHLFLLIAGAGSLTCQIKELVTDEIKDEEKSKCWRKTYCIVGDNMLRVDELPIYVSRCCG